MAKTVYINFDAANIISHNMEQIMSESKTLVTKCNSASESLNKYSTVFKSTISNCSNIEKSINDACENLNNIHNGFDRTVDSYYQLENIDYVSKNEKTIEIPVANENKIKQYHWKTELKGSMMKKMSNSEMIDMLTSKGWTRKGSRYMKDGYICHVNSGELRITYNGDDFKGEQVCLSFYKTANSSYDDINKSITFIGGSGQSDGGSNYFLDNQISINDDTIVMSLFHGGSGKKYGISSNQVVTATKFTDDIFGISGSDNRSIVGFSRGGITAAETVSKNKGLFDNMVMVNSATFDKDGPDKKCFKLENYDNFKDTDIVYLECANGWGSNKGITNSVNDFISNGVDASRITVITNDNNLVNDLNKTGINIDSSVPSKYNDHGAAWGMLQDSSLFEDLIN